MAIALRYRQAGRIVTVFEATERVERRGHATVASRDRALLALLDELDLSAGIRWDSNITLNGTRFGALIGGRARIIETLRDRARALDVDIRLGTPVGGVATDGTGFEVNTGADTGEFDEVIMTVPSPVVSELLDPLPERERLALGTVGYVGIITVSFVINSGRVPLAAARYIQRVSRGGDHFALVDPSVLNPRDESRSGVVYITRPLAAHNELFGAGDRQVIEHFARAVPGSSDILSARVMRMPHAFAQGRLDSFTSSVPGLSIVNAAHMGGGRHHLERTAALALTAFRQLCAERIT